MSSSLEPSTTSASRDVFASDIDSPAVGAVYTTRTFGFYSVLVTHTLGFGCVLVTVTPLIHRLGQAVF